MNASSPQTAPNPSRTFLLVWAILATLGAGVFGSTTVFLCLILRKQSAIHPAPASTVSSSDRIVLSENFAPSNSVGVILGRTEIDGGITHLPDWSDGWTRADVLDGVPCRYMNHRAPNLAGGAYLYFAIHSTYKSVEIKAAQIEFEYFTRTPIRLKLQYDGMEDGRHRAFKSASEVFNVPGSNDWQTVVFHVTEPSFLNSQMGGADFRLDVNPPEIYLRRVILKRE